MTAVRSSGRRAAWRGMSAALAAALMLTLASCGGGSNSTSTGNGSGSGTLKLAITDAPTCGYDAVHVTIQKVRVHQSSSAAEGDGGWHEVVLPAPRRIDLVTLTNGVLEELGQTALPAGKYTQLRLVLAPNSAADPLANSVTPTGAAETALTTPSGQQSGLKTNIDIDVAADKVADFVLDFKVCESIVKRGNSGQYNLKPVITMLPRLSDAGMRVVGFLDPLLAPATTTVSVQQNGKPVRTTPPDATGKFVLYPVPAGNYDLVINAQGRVTAVITAVPVVTTAYTYVNTELTRLAPPAAVTLRNASGTVATGVTPVDANLRVLKGLTGGASIELFSAPVDALTGGFSYALPADAPLIAPYAALPAPLVFSADPATPTGRYTLEASSGAALKLVPIDLSTAASTSTITLP